MSGGPNNACDHLSLYCTALPRLVLITATFRVHATVKARVANFDGGKVEEWDPCSVIY